MLLKGTIIIFLIFTGVFIYYRFYYKEKEEKKTTKNEEQDSKKIYPDIEALETEAVYHLKEGLKNIPDVGSWQKIVEQYERDQK